MLRSLHAVLPARLPLWRAAPAACAVRKTLAWTTLCLPLACLQRSAGTAWWRCRWPPPSRHWPMPLWRAPDRRSLAARCTSAHAAQPAAVPEQSACCALCPAPDAGLQAGMLLFPRLVPAGLPAVPAGRGGPQPALSALCLCQQWRVEAAAVRPAGSGPEGLPYRIPRRAAAAPCRACSPASGGGMLHLLACMPRRPEPPRFPGLLDLPAGPPPRPPARAVPCWQATPGWWRCAFRPR